MGGRRDLRGRVAIVTGASSGIGAATAERFAREQMRIVLAARRERWLAAVAGRVRAAGGEPLVVPGDIRDPQAAVRMAAAAQEAWGRIDVLVANAGVGGGSILQITDEVLTELVEVNLLGVMRSVRAVLPAMRAQREGHIITIASVAGRVIAPGGTYGATKAGVLAFTQGLARVLPELGIRVSAVLPGWVDTPMVRTRPRWITPPGVVADTIVGLLRRPRREVVVPRWYRLVLLMNHLLPGVVMDYLAPRVTRRAQRRMEDRARTVPSRPPGPGPSAEG